MAEKEPPVDPSVEAFLRSVNSSGPPPRIRRSLVFYSNEYNSRLETVPECASDEDMSTPDLNQLTFPTDLPTAGNEFPQLTQNAPSNVDNRRNRYPENVQSQRAKTRDSYSNVMTTTTTTSITLTPSVSSTYASITASRVRPLHMEFPRHVDRLLLNIEARHTIFIEHLPNWTFHFRKLLLKLGHSLNARSYGKGIQFIPKTLYEQEIVQSYLTNLLKTEPGMTCISYTPTNEKPHKVGIKGLPNGTPISEIKEALKGLNVPVKTVQAIPAKNRLKCLYIVELGYLSQNQMERLFSIHELLNMSGIYIEDYSKSRSLQYQRRETFESSVTQASRHPLLKKKQKRDTLKRNDNEIDDDNDEKWVTVGRNEAKNLPKLSSRTGTIKKHVEGQSNTNRYAALVNPENNKPSPSNVFPSIIKTKSMKRREKQKNRMDWNNLLYTSTSTLDTAAEATEIQDTAAKDEIEEEQGVEEIREPSPPYHDCLYVAESEPNIKDTNEINDDELKDLLRECVETLGVMNVTTDTINTTLETALDGANNLQDKEDAKE